MTMSVKKYSKCQQQKQTPITTTISFIFTPLSVVLLRNLQIYKISEYQKLIYLHLCT